MKLTLMFREYCSLCHAMRDRLTALQQERPFELEVVDVDDDPLLEEKYNYEIGRRRVGKECRSRWSPYH